MKTIGVIGGMGPQATMDFEARIHRISQKLIPQFVNRGYPPMVVYYVREAPMVLNSDGSTPEKLEPAPQLLDAAKKLGAVADFLVIASNTPHFFKKEIEEAAGLRILSIVQVTLEKIKRERYKKVGIIAVGDTLKHRLYQEPLERMGVANVTITAEASRRLDEEIWALMEGKVALKNRSPLETMKFLFPRDVEAVILGCTELPILFDEWVGYPFMINPGELLAEAAVRYAIS